MQTHSIRTPVQSTALSVGTSPKARSHGILSVGIAKAFITDTVAFGSVARKVPVTGLPQVGKAHATLYFDETGKDPGKILLLEGAARTPFGKPETLKAFNEIDLATVAAKGTIAGAKLDPTAIDYTFWGCVDQTSPYAKAMAHVARRVGAGDVNNATLNKQCGSGLYAIQLGADYAGNWAPDKNFVALVGGVEKMRPTFVSYGLVSHLKAEGDKAKKQFGRMPMWKKLAIGIPKLAPLLVSPKAWRHKVKDGESFTEQVFLNNVLSTVAPELRASLRAAIQGKPYKGDLGWHVSSIADAETGYTMADTAERLQRSSAIVNHWITPEELDQFTFDSHARARDAWQKGRFTEGGRPEVVPITDATGKTVLQTDESVRMIVHPDGTIGELATSLEEIASKRAPGKPSNFHRFHKYDASHSAPNASAVVTGASAALVTNSETLERLIKAGKIQSDDPVLGEVVAIAEVSVPQRLMGLGAARATQAVLKASGLKLEQMDRLEINEAFAGVALSAMRILSRENNVDYDTLYRKTNVNGGAIAIGHPLGGSGTRLPVTLAKELKRNNLQYGLATLCIGDGEGIAVIIKNPGYRNPKVN